MNLATSGLESSLNDVPAARRLWDELPRHAFLRLDTTRRFARDHVLVAVRTRGLIRDVRVEATCVGALQFARLDVLHCGGVPCAYVFSAAGSCALRCRETYCTFSVRGDHAHDPSPLFDDGTIGVVGDANALVGFLLNRSYWISP